MMNKTSRREFRQHSLLWLFQKRFFFENRKYTSGIILTAGVTALFVSMLVIGSSFISASYRATGENGPSIFGVSYDASTINVTQAMPAFVNVTCGIADYFALDSVRVHYSTDFWKSSKHVNGTLLHANLTGRYFRFSLPMDYSKKTHLFFVWANNSAGYFGFNDNNGNYYSIRMIDDEEDPVVNPTVPPMKLVQRLEIGYDNQTTTRNPRPDIKIWLNGTSSAWIVVNGDPQPEKTGANFYLFQLDADLAPGPNALSIHVLQAARLYNISMTITRSMTALAKTSSNPGVNQTVYNRLDSLRVTMNDWTAGTAALVGPSNHSWTMTQFKKVHTFPFNGSFGNYSLLLDLVDPYGFSYTGTVPFTFMKSPFPHITVNNVANQSTLTNSSITLQLAFTEPCNSSVENMDLPGSIVHGTGNASAVNISGIPLARGWNHLNISAINAEGNRNSTILHVYQVPYIIKQFSYDVFVVPGSSLKIQMQFSTNYTASGTVRYDYNFENNFKIKSFSLASGTSKEGTLRVEVPAPAGTFAITFNCTFQFGPEVEHVNQFGNNFYVPVEYLYQDMQGPVVQQVWLNPDLNAITSNNQVQVTVRLYDVSGVSGATLVYATSNTFASNKSVAMTFLNDGVNGIGRWRAVIPPHDNSTRVYYMIRSTDVLNQTATYTGSFLVSDRIESQNKVVPGILETNYEKAITGAITTLLTIMVLIIVVFIVIFVSMNDQSVKREMYREEERIFILKNVCKLDDGTVKKYYYTEQLIQDAIGYSAGLAVGFFLLAPIFVEIVKVTLIAWTFDFQAYFYLAYHTLESWVGLLLLLFIISSLLLKILQVDKHIEGMAH